MSIAIQEVKSKRELKQFIKFPLKLYKKVPQFVPPMMDFELSTLQASKNPAFDTCEARYWLAYKDQEIVGRIAGIIHQAEANSKRIMRFGWIDFIDDYEVSEKLISTVIEWAKEKNLTAIQGPMGFTDLDFQGMLVDGFDQVMTQATLYNFPYYLQHLERLGFEKEVDWVEQRKKMPDEPPIKPELVSKLCEKYNMKVKELKSKKELLNYSKEIFDLLNETYSHLHGFYPLTERQIQYFIEQYFGFAKKEFITIIVDKEDQVIGFAISFPSLSGALKKANGSLFPFGFVHLLKAFHSNKIVDLFLIAAKNKNQGVNALLWYTLYRNYKKFGIEQVHTGQMLEENNRVLNATAKFEDVHPDSQIRRRCLIKHI